MAPFPNQEAYPKTLLLRDETKAIIRPLESGDKIRLLRFFERIPEADRYYLKENITAPEVIREWTSKIDHQRAIPIVAVVDDKIVADASLHRSRSPARRHMGELRVVVEPSYLELGLGKRLINELLDIAAEIGLHKATFELVAQREKPALLAAYSIGFKEVATVQEWIRDLWGNYQDLVQLELPLEEREVWRKF